jgi:hypothetical protein
VQCGSWSLDFCEEHGIKTWDYLRDAHLSLAWHKMFLFEHHEELIWKRGRTVFKIEPEGFLYRFSRYDIITREPAWVYHKDYAFMCPSLKPERMHGYKVSFERSFEQSV